LFRVLVAASKAIVDLMKAIDTNSDDEESDVDDENHNDTFDETEENQQSNKKPIPPPVAPSMIKKPSNRRFSVSAESVDPNKLREDLSKVAVIPKDSSTLMTLEHVVLKSPMLSKMLDNEQRGLIINAFSGPLYKHPGDVIIQQGDIGDVFYLLEMGKVDVFIKRKRNKNDNSKVEEEKEPTEMNPQTDEAESRTTTAGNTEELKVHTYNDGDTFGELALMYDAPRAATCRAVHECKLWTLDRTSFKVLIVGATLRKREIYLSFLSQVSILSSLTENEKMILADSILEERYTEGTIICQEGSYEHNFYIIMNGKVGCYQKDKKNLEKENLVLTLTTGQYFGEIALLTSKPRQATVKAIEGDVKVLVVDRATFTRVFGPLEPILKRNMEIYNKYTTSNQN
jgi:cAMP-dependent protein kinase regulator